MAGNVRTDQALNVDEHHPQPLGRPPPSQGNKELSPLSLGPKPEAQLGAGVEQEHDSDKHSEDSWELLSGDDSPRVHATRGRSLELPPRPASVTVPQPETPALRQESLGPAETPTVAAAGAADGAEPAVTAACEPACEAEDEQCVAESGEAAAEGEPASPVSSVCEAEGAAADVYSLSQEGSINGYSDSESSHVADELMALAEPDHRASLAAFPQEGSGGGAACEKQGSSADDKSQDALAPAPAGGLYAVVSAQLSALSAGATEYATAGTAAATELVAAGATAAAELTTAGAAAATEAGARMWALLEEWLDTLQVRVLGVYAPLKAALAGEELGELTRRLRFAVDRLVKQAALKNVDWTKVVLGAGCVALAAVCLRTRRANQDLAGKLAQRDAELAELVGRILTLRHRNSSVPIIRPVACRSAVAPWGHLLHAV
ncbi:hypothetical protein N2152v2_008043 [Parachlorella kessleri]